MPRPELTLIIVLEDRMIRGDYQFVAGGKQVEQGLPQCVNLMTERMETDELRTAVETALFMAGEVGKRTVVLSTEVMSRMLMVPAHAVGKLKDDELKTALAFEAESVVDLPASEVTLGFQLLDDEGVDRRYWVQALDTEWVTSISFAVERAGSKLVGVGHPGGLPISFAQLEEAIENYSESEKFDYWGAGSSRNESPWHRVEKWPGMIVGARGGHTRSSEEYDVELLEVDPRSLNWRSALRHFFDDATESGVLEASAAVVMAEVDMLDEDSEGPRDDDWFSGVVQRKTQSTERLCSDDRLFHELDERRRWRSLTNEESQELFLTAWAFTAQTMVTKSTSHYFSMPLIKAPKRPVSLKKMSWVGVALFVIVTVLCYLHWQSQTQQVMEISAENKKRKDLESEVKKLEKQVAENKEKLETLANVLADLRTNVDNRARTMTANKAKWQMLLAFIARSAPENLFLSSMTTQSDRVRISGICLEPELANELATALQKTMPHLGWQVLPPKKSSLNLTGEGSPYVFDIDLEIIQVKPAQQMKRQDSESEAPLAQVTEEASDES